MAQSALAVTANWLGPSGNSIWGDSSNWSTHPNYPNNGTPTGVTYDAVIASGSFASDVISASNITIDSLSQSAGAASVFGTGDITINNGLTLNAFFGFGRHLYLNSMTVGGSGTINSGGLIEPRAGANATITFAPSLTIRTTGSTHDLSIGSLTEGVIINNAPISADGPTVTLSARGNFTNNATINITSSARLAIGPGSGWVNNGLIRLAPGTTLLLGGTNILESQIGPMNRNGASVILTGSLHDQTIATDAFGGGWTIGLYPINTTFIPALISNCRIIPGAGNQQLVTSGPTRFDAVTLDANVLCTTGTPHFFTGGLTLNQSTLTFSGSCTPCFAGNTSIDGTGTLSFEGTGTGNEIWLGAQIYSLTAGLVTLGPGITLKSKSAAGSPNTVILSPAGLLNRGIISAQSPASFEFGGPSAKGTFNNQGVVEARNGGTFRITSTGTLANFGGGVLQGRTWAAYANSTLDLVPIGDIVTNAADIILSGPGSSFPKINKLATNNGSFTITAGRDFTTVGALANNATLFTGVGSDLMITGDLTESSTSTTAFELSRALTPEDFGQFTVTNIAHLAGTLRIAAAPANTVHPGDTFPLLFASSLDGSFTTLSLPPGWSGTLLYSPSTVTLSITSIPEPTILLPLLLLIAPPRRSRTILLRQPIEKVLD